MQNVLTAQVTHGASKNILSITESSGWTFCIWSLFSCTEVLNRFAPQVAESSGWTRFLLLGVAGVEAFCVGSRTRLMDRLGCGALIGLTVSGSSHVGSGNGIPERAAQRCVRSVQW